MIVEPVGPRAKLDLTMTHWPGTWQCPGTGTHESMMPLREASRTCVFVVAVLVYGRMSCVTQTRRLSREKNIVTSVSSKAQ